MCVASLEVKLGWPIYRMKLFHGKQLFEIEEKLVVGFFFIIAVIN